jgi:hypothetical protein
MPFATHRAMDGIVPYKGSEARGIATQVSADALIWGSKVQPNAIIWAHLQRVK